MISVYSDSYIYWPDAALEELQANLQYLDDCQLECDGMTYAISCALEKANIEHKRMVGHVHWYPGQDVVDPHCWITLPGGMVVDFRLRMWVGDDESIPHGVFIPDPFEVRYVGVEQTSITPSQEVLEIMTDGRLSKLKLYPPEGISYGSTYD